MSDSWRFGRIIDFERVAVGPTALLRITAMPGQVRGPEGARPTLVADDGETVSHFAAIPAPPDAEELLRAAYSVPADKVTSNTVFSLEFEDGFVIALPDPSQGAARVNRRSPAAAEVSAPIVEPVLEPADEDDHEERRSALHPKLTELSGELAETRHANLELRGAAEAAHVEARETRSALLHLHLQAAETQAELEAVRELAILTSVVAEPADRAQFEAARERADAAERELAAERDQTLILTARVTELEAELTNLRDRESAAEAFAPAPSLSEEESARLSELEIWTAELERRLGETTTELAQARAELDAAATAEAELARLRDEPAAAQAQAEPVAEPEGLIETEPSADDEPAPIATEEDAAAPETGEDEPATALSEAPHTSPSGLRDVLRQAVADAHDEAERDLADHGR